MLCHHERDAVLCGNPLRRYAIGIDEGGVHEGEREALADPRNPSPGSVVVRRRLERKCRVPRAYNKAWMVDGDERAQLMSCNTAKARVATQRGELRHRRAVGDRRYDLHLASLRKLERKPLGPYTQRWKGVVRIRARQNK